MSDQPSKAAQPEEAAPESADPEPATAPPPTPASEPATEPVTEPVTEPTPTPVPVRLPRPPPYAFLKGTITGLVLLIPLTALAVYLLGVIGIGDPRASYTRIIAFVAVFAGVPAVLSAGGIGHAAARIAVTPTGGPAWSVFLSILEASACGAGLVILTVVPLGEVPAGWDRWLWICGLGGAAGAVGGLVLGLWVSYPARAAS